MKGRQNRKETDKYRVHLYKLLHNAPAPMTFDEIVKGMMAAPGNFSRACVNYQEHVGVRGDLDERGQDMAKRWWVLDLLTASSGYHPSGSPKLEANKIFISRYPGEARAPLASPDRLWSANPDNPPWIYAETVSRELVRWTPEIGSSGAKVSAGMRYLSELDAYRAKHAKIPKELAEILDAGEQAIRNTTTPAGS